MKTLAYCVTLLLGIALPSTFLHADSQVGDWGHFLRYQPRVYLNNPDGEAFTVTVHAMQWGTEAWVRDTLPIRITNPSGEVVVEGEQKLTEAAATFDFPKGSDGVWIVEAEKQFFLSTSLDHAVLHTGDPEAHSVEGRRAIFQASVPRRWWFWVPDDVTEFTVRAMRAGRYMSQREDWGFFIVSPRGQRVRALWGQPPITPRKEYQQEQVAKVEVEPGTGGRFWAVEVQLGDSHQYSDINLAFEGVPPYLARSPEEWFNPETGSRPTIAMYDDDPFMQSARIEEVMAKKWPNLEHFSPSPSLGDPDGIEILPAPADPANPASAGAAEFAMWNPDSRQLAFRIGTYLPRKGFRNQDEAHAARVTVTKMTHTEGQPVIFQDNLPLLHLHGKDGQPNVTLETGKAVARVRVENFERFMAFTYPATPLVLLGQRTPHRDLRTQFHLTACAPRNWYFQVPEGVEQFTVSAGAWHDTDVLKMEINAPDRTVAMIYGNSGRARVKVPDGLDGKIWHLRPSVGSATRMVTKQPPYRYQDMPITIEFRQLQPVLAPTWEQWFNPHHPKPPHQRGQNNR